MTLQVQKIKFSELSDSVLEQLVEILMESEQDYYAPIPTPPRSLVKKRMTLPPNPDTERHRFIAIDSDVVVAYASISYDLIGNNTRFARLTIRTLREYRRHGYAKALAKYIQQYIPNQIQYFSFTVKHSEESRVFEAYLQKIGAKSVLPDRMSASHITEFDPANIQEIAQQELTKTKNRGFEIIEVEEYKFEQHNINYAKYLKVLERIWNDMPRDEASFDDEIISEEQHKSYLQNRHKIGALSWTFVAKHIISGKIVGLTESVIQTQHREVAYQDDTGVLAEFRGNGLGLALKYQMLNKLLHDPRSQHVEYWITHNAHSNTPMLRINEVLHYKPLNTYNEYELLLAQFHTAIAQ